MIGRQKNKGEDILEEKSYSLGKRNSMVYRQNYRESSPATKINRGAESF